jgi:hypothetical protein
MPKRSTSPTFGRGSLGTSSQFNFPMGNSASAASAAPKRPIVGTSTEWSHRDASLAQNFSGQYDEALSQHFGAPTMQLNMSDPMPPPQSETMFQGGGNRRTTPRSAMPPKAPSNGGSRLPSPTSKRSPKSGGKVTPSAAASGNGNGNGSPGKALHFCVCVVETGCV